VIGPLVPAIWLPDPAVRGERERARWRLHLVRHRSSLKQRVHAVLLAHGKPCPVSDLFGVRGRQLLARLRRPEPWQGTIDVSLRLIDQLDREIDECERELRRLGVDHRYVPLLRTVPGIGWVLAYTIAAEIGDINASPYRANSPATPASARASTNQASAAEAIWHMLTRDQPFAPAGPLRRCATGANSDRPCPPARRRYREMSAAQPLQHAHPP
jgi:hypothetical protein